MTFVKAQSTYGLLSKEEKIKVKKAQEDNSDLLKIPRRPLWDKTTTGEELQQWEREAFMSWRKDLSELQEVEGITMTPYEKNLEFWRQLWRVIERSDIIVQIVDARNPLLFRCRDLELYVKEVGGEKMNLILINKADFLSETQRRIWAEYFDTINLPIAFFSALEENENALRNLRINEETEEDNEQHSDSDNSEDEQDYAEQEKQVLTTVQEAAVKQTEPDVGAATTDEPTTQSPTACGKNSTKLLSRDELIHLLKTIHKGQKVQENRTVAGLVGYPNVGKSSTINSLLTYKKVSVSATPGKTKHFQVCSIHTIH